MNKWYAIGVNECSVTGADNKHEATHMYNAICTTLCLITRNSNAKRAYAAWITCEDSDGSNRELLEERAVIGGRSFSVEDFKRFYYDCKFIEYKVK